MRFNPSSLVLASFAPIPTPKAEIPQFRAVFDIANTAVGIASPQQILKLLSAQLKSVGSELVSVQYPSAEAGRMTTTFRSRLSVDQAEGTCRDFAACFSQASNVDSSEGPAVACAHIELWASIDAHSVVAPWFCEKEEDFADNLVTTEEVWPPGATLSFRYEMGRTIRLVHTKISALRKHFPDMFGDAST